MQKLISTNNGALYFPQNTNRFIYDGWNLIAALNPQSSIIQSFVWGIDISGSQQADGGVGGLMALNDPVNGPYFPIYDGNGNVGGLVKGADGTVTAQYEYGPFGEVIRATGPTAKSNFFLFSTKYQDDETDMLYYGLRYYNPVDGRWLNRDPGQEQGPELNLYCLVKNNPTDFYDHLGLWATAVHHQIIDDWLPESYDSYKWHCCTIHVKALLKNGSDNVDGELGSKFCDFFYPGFWLAQSTGRAYEHAMRSPSQQTCEAEALYYKFINDHIVRAKRYADLARMEGVLGVNKEFMEIAIAELGKAYHAYSDNESPAHMGFQPWWGPAAGVYDFGPSVYYGMIMAHHDAETMDVYLLWSDLVVEDIDEELFDDLTEVLQE